MAEPAARQSGQSGQPQPGQPQSGNGPARPGPENPPAVRAPSRAYRILDAGRRRPPEGAVQRGRAPRHDPCRDDRPRQHVRRGRVPPPGQGRRHHPGDRHRGLRGPGKPGQHQAHPVGPAAPEEGRRLGQRRVPAQDHLGAQQGRPAQPVQAVLPLLRGGLAGQVAADGQRDPGRARQRPDGLHRLPLRGAADPAAPRPIRRGPPVRCRIPGDLRQGELLPGADGPRARHREKSQGRPGRNRPETAHPAGRHQRLALHPGTRRHLARPAALHPDRQDPRRRGPVPLRRERLLHQVRRRDVRHRHLRGLAGRLPEQPAPGR